MYTAQQLLGIITNVIFNFFLKKYIPDKVDARLRFTPKSIKFICMMPRSVSLKICKLLKTTCGS